MFYENNKHLKQHFRYSEKVYTFSEQLTKVEDFRKKIDGNNGSNMRKEYKILNLLKGLLHFCCFPFLHFRANHFVIK